MSQYITHIKDDLITYWGTCLCLHIYDKLFLPINRKANLPDTWINIFKFVLFNQFFVTFPVFYLLSFKDVYEGDGLLELNNLYKFPLVLVFHEFMFFHLHYALHTYELFRQVHYIHHRWKNPIAISTIYTHPLEQLFVNVLPILISGLVCNLNFVSMRAWHIFSILNSLILAHGGYKFGNDFSFHDKHHTKIKYNYGTIGLFDKLYGTYF